MLIYLSGPITGIPENNKAAFNEAALNLREKGYEVINPLELDEGDGEMDWFACLKRDLKVLCDCDAIMLLDNWHKSAGANLEFLVATRLGLKFYFYDNYLKGIYSALH